MEDFKAMLSSELFTFLIGSERRKVSIYKNFVKKVSDPLHALMNNGMSESQTGQVILDDVDYDTFASFCLWAVFRDYTVNVIKVAKPSIQQERVATEDTIKYRVKARKAPAVKKVYVQDNSVGLWEHFKEKRFSPTDGALQENLDYDKYLTAATPSNNPLIHAKLYIFADKWLIKPLKALCLGKLHKDLVNYEMDASTIPNLIETIRYAYAGVDYYTPDAADSALRELIITYVAAEADVLVQARGFRELLQQEGYIGADLVLYMTLRRNDRGQSYNGSGHM